MLAPSLVLDLICLVILISCILFYARKGFLSGIVSLVGTIAAALAGYFGGQKLAPALFDRAFRPNLEQQAAEAITAQGVPDLNALLGSLAAFLPQGTLQELTNEFASSTDLSAAALATQLVDTVIQPLVVPILAVLLFVIIFVVLRLLVSLLSRILTGARHVPVLGVANSALGAVTGVLMGALYILLAVLVVGAAASVWAGVPDEDIFSRSVVWNLLSNIRILSF